MDVFAARAQNSFLLPLRGEVGTPPLTAETSPTQIPTPASSLPHREILSRISSGGGKLELHDSQDLRSKECLVLKSNQATRHVLYMRTGLCLSTTTLLAAAINEGFEVTPVNFGVGLSGT